MIKISISIVTYNNSNIIRKTLNSILSSIPPQYKYDFFVIDNNSNDDTCEIIERDFPTINLIKLSNNGGFGKGHNTILNMIDSKYHFVVNPDILIENSEQVEIMIDYLEKNEEISLLSPLILNPDNTTQHLIKRNPTVLDMVIRRISPNLLKQRQNRYIMLDSGYNSIMPIEYASGCFMLFRTKVYKQINGFDTNFFMYLEDADVTRRINQVGNSIFFPFANVVHEWERASHKKLKYLFITIKSMILYFNKWGWKLW